MELPDPLAISPPHLLPNSLQLTMYLSSIIFLFTVPFFEKWQNLQKAKFSDKDPPTIRLSRKLDDIVQENSQFSSLDTLEVVYVPLAPQTKVYNQP